MVFNSQTFSLWIAPVGIRHWIAPLRHALLTELQSTSTNISFCNIKLYKTEEKKAAFPLSPIPQKCFKRATEKGMLCAINTSIWICCKTCYKTTKALYFYCTLCGPASGFHKAVSVYHTWLSNNPVVGQTQLYPQDITPATYAGQVSIHPSLPALPFFTLFVLLLYHLYTTL